MVTRQYDKYIVRYLNIESLCCTYQTNILYQLYFNKKKSIEVNENIESVQKEIEDV